MGDCITSFNLLHPLLSPLYLLFIRGGVVILIVEPSILERKPRMLSDQSDPFSTESQYKLFSDRSPGTTGPVIGPGRSSGGNPGHRARPAR
eukprot:478826-Hanusia_phi.AAC.1